MASNVTINISPSPGFCVKSKVTSTQTQTHRPIPISQGLKVFVNIGWSNDLPPPLDGIGKTSEFLARMELKKNERDTSISVFASDGRLDTDKAGKSALVFDCIFYSSLKNHAFKDVAFKSFLVELALLQIEAENSISLSRTLGTPNILSKGALEKRAISIPANLFPPGHRHGVFVDNSCAKKLIEEVADNPAVAPFLDHVHPRESVILHSNGTYETPSWTWGQEGGDIRITIQVPKLTYATISSATLDLEPRRLTLLIPDLYELNIDLELSDGALGKARSSVELQGPENVAMLKRARDLDVDRARVEWRVKERFLVIVA